MVDLGGFNQAAQAGVKANTLGSNKLGRYVSELIGSDCEPDSNNQVERN